MSDRSLLPTHIDLRPVGEAVVRLEREFAPDQLGVDPRDFTVRGPARFVGTLSRKGERFELEGQVQASLELPCGRCLEPLVWPVDAALSLTYVPERSGGEGEEVELHDEDLDTAFYRDQTLDLGEMLREQFYLSLPMQPLCREDCNGLCPQCGINRNHETCDCQPVWEDPRLAGLRALLTPKSTT